MLITETARSTAPNSVDNDDEISFLYSIPPPPNNKGKSIQIDHTPVDHDEDEDDDDDDEIQLLFSTNIKKRKSLIFGSSSKGIQETQFENHQLNPKKKQIIHLDDDDDDDDEIQFISSLPTIENPNLIGNFGVNSDSGDLRLLMCEICAEEKKKIEFLSVMGCDHSYCFECIVRYVDSRLKENVVEISCPVLECEGFLGLEYCRSILPTEVYDRWGLALCEEVISPSQKFYCPYKECSALMIDDSEETGEVIRKLKCPNCERMFCVKCKVGWHEGMECEEFEALSEDERGREDVLLVKLAKKNMWKRCPRCKMYVQRSQGCNSMLCRCGCGFCYACGSSFGSCQCTNGIPHHLPGEAAMNLANRIRAMTQQVNPVNQTPTNPPIQLRQAQFRVPEQLLNLSADETQANPSIQPLQHRVRELQIEQMRLQYRLANQMQQHLQQGPVGDGSNTSQVRQQLDQNRPANQTRPNPTIQPLQQGPVRGGPDASRAFQQLELRRFQMMPAYQTLQAMRRLEHNRSANQTQPNPSIQPLQQGPVEGHVNTSLVRQQLAQIRSANQTRSNPSTQPLQLEQNRPANQTPSNQPGPVRGGPGTSQTRQQLEQILQMRLAGQDFNRGQLARMQFERINWLRNLAPNQTHSNTAVQPLVSSVTRTNEFIQASPGLPGTSHVDPMENLSARETQFSQGSSGL